MPIWLRRFHIQTINQYFKDIEKENEKYKSDDRSNKIIKPDIDPSSTYNFKR